MKRKVLEKIREANLLEQHELDYIIKELNKNKKYGLVWEDHPEDVELELKDGIFRIEELKDKRIEANLEGRENLLLEGDNLHSLMALKDAGVKVDVIYIDPPYNTLNETGFRYNDKRIDSNDNYRHSKWLSFMYKRLELARDLMKDDGVIFVSIDDNEQANLKLLLDQVFGERNFISNFVWEHNTAPSNLTRYVRQNTEHILLYSKNKECLNELVEEEKIKKDNFSLYNKTNKLREWTIPKEYISTKLDDGVYEEASGENVELVNKVIVKEGKFINDVVLKSRFTLKEDTMLKRLRNREMFITINTDTFTPRGVGLNKITKIRPKNLITGKGTTLQSNIDMKNIFGDSDFDYTKPVVLIKYLIKLINDKNATVLDFFAGSGTTGQAAMELNKEDGGNRRFILCTNNENNICEEVTYERNRRVITGEYAKEKVEPLPNNLSYYKVDILNKNSINYKEKEELEVIKNKYLAEWKEDVKIVKEDEEYALMENNNKKVLFIKTGTISESTKKSINLNDIDKIYMMKHLSRDKMFKGVDESKLELI